MQEHPTHPAPGTQPENREILPPPPWGATESGEERRSRLEGFAAAQGVTYTRAEVLEQKRVRGESRQPAEQAAVETTFTDIGRARGVLEIGEAARIALLAELPGPESGETKTGRRDRLATFAREQGIRLELVTQLEALRTGELTVGFDEERQETALTSERDR